MTQSNSSVEAVAARLAAEIMAAVRSAKIPKVYAAEELDEFEALTLTPMLVAALASIPLPDKGVEELVALEERLRSLADRHRDTMGLTREGAIKRVERLHDALLDTADKLSGIRALQDSEQ